MQQSENKLGERKKKPLYHAVNVNLTTNHARYHTWWLWVTKLLAVSSASAHHSPSPPPSAMAPPPQPHNKKTGQMMLLLFGPLVSIFFVVLF